MIFAISISILVKIFYNTNKMAPGLIELYVLVLTKLWIYCDIGLTVPSPFYSDLWYALGHLTMLFLPRFCLIYMYKYQKQHFMPRFSMYLNIETLLASTTLFMRREPV